MYSVKRPDRLSALRPRNVKCELDRQSRLLPLEIVVEKPGFRRGRHN